MKTHAFAVFVLLAILSLGPAFGQMTVTGSISGNVIDQSGRGVPGAKVTLVSERTKETRGTSSNELGAFSLVAVQPDTYSVTVEHAGFKAFKRTGIVVTANEHIVLGQVPLEVGSVSETITVEAKAAHVETDTAEQSAEITQNQLGNLMARGRDVVSMMRTVPGVYYSAD